VVTNEKTPLQAVVSVLCDTLCQLPLDDRSRALEAVHVTLGIPSEEESNVLNKMIVDLFTSLQPTQVQAIQALASVFEMSQQIMVMHIVEHVMPRSPPSMEPPSPPTVAQFDS
jgi:hypothetical protein